MLDFRRQELMKLLVANPAMPMSEAMKQVGYSESYANSSNQLTKSKSFIQVLNETIQDESVVETMRAVLNRRVLKIEKFDLDISDESILEHIEKIGGQFTKIRVKSFTDQKKEKRGKIFKWIDFEYEAKEVRYYIPDLDAVDKMMDKFFKLRGNYAPEKESGRLTIGSLLINLIQNGTGQSKIPTIIAKELEVAESIPDQGQTGQNSAVSTEPSAEALSS